jgi:hypothetical protein
VPGTLGWPGTGRAASFAGGPSGADPEPVPRAGVICVFGGGVGLVGPVVCAYALPAIIAATAVALISLSIIRSIWRRAGVNGSAASVFLLMERAQKPSRSCATTRRERGTTLVVAPLWLTRNRRGALEKPAWQ